MNHIRESDDLAAHIVHNRLAVFAGLLLGLTAVLVTDIALDESFDGGRITSSALDGAATVDAKVGHLVLEGEHWLHQQAEQLIS